MAAKTPITLEIQISIENGSWPDMQTLLLRADEVLHEAAVYLAAEIGQPFPDDGVEVSLLFTDDASIRKINAEWRDQDKPTNVLSFPALSVEPGDMPGPMMGDIILAHETLVREAADLGKSFDDHCAHLLVHGFLHLLGYDHMDDEEAEEMEGLETRILARLGLSDPYGENDVAA